MRLIILLILASIILLATAFNAQKCEHVFTMVQQSVVKVDIGSNIVYPIYTAPPYGVHEGVELICVKCFHKQKQVIDYGQAQQSYLSPIGNSLWGTSIDTCSLTLTSILGGSGFITLKVDTGFGLIK